MPPELRRILPLMLVVIFAFFLLPNLLHRSHKSGLSDKQKAANTKEAVKLIDRGEQGYNAAHGRFTSHLADLLAANPKIANDLVGGMDVQLDVSTKGQTYLEVVTSDVMRIVRVHNGATIAAQSCLVLKSSSGVHCQ